MSTIKDIINYVKKGQLSSIMNSRPELQLVNNRCLSEAVQCGRLDVVKYLVENGADILDIPVPSLNLAIALKYYDVIKYLFTEEPRLNKYCSELISVAIKTESNQIKEFLKRRLESENNKSKKINFLFDV
jgi:Cdc6-like AAA superfamily ATPase